MTGREFIIYILENNLENETVFKDGIFVGFLSEEEAAVKFNVGVGTIKLWHAQGKLRGIKIGESIYFLKTVTDPRGTTWKK